MSTNIVGARVNVHTDWRHHHWPSTGTVLDPSDASDPYCIVKLDDGHLVQVPPDGLTPAGLTFVVERIGKSVGFCPTCQSVEVPVIGDELSVHKTVLGHLCGGDKHSRCESRKHGARCQLPPHDDGMHARDPGVMGGLIGWRDEGR